MEKSKKIFKIIFWTINFLILFSLHFFQSRLNSDNGIFLSGAWSLANNFNIYKDFFSFTTPGTYYLILIAWEVFGISYWVAWGTALSLLIVSSFLIFKITSYLNRQGAYLAVIMFSLASAGWPIITSHIFCLPFVLGAIYLIITGIKQNKLNLIYLAGILAGVSILFLQTIGLATLVGIFTFLIFYYLSKNNTLKIKNLVVFLLFSLLPILVLFLKWPPSFLFDTLIKFPLYNYSETITTSYWFLGINFFLLFVIYLSLKKDGAKSSIINLLFILQIFLFLTTFSFPDLIHLSFIFAPLLILFSTLAFELFKFKLNKNFYATFIIFFIFLFYFIFYFFISITFGGFEPLIIQKKNPELVNFIDNNCRGKYLYAGPFIPEFYFETRTLNPGPTHWLLTNHHTPEHFLKTLQGLQEKKPDCAIVNYKMVQKLNYNKNNIVDDYLSVHYQEIFKYGDTYILKRAR